MTFFREIVTFQISLTAQTGVHNRDCARECVSHRLDVLSAVHFTILIFRTRGRRYTNCMQLRSLSPVSLIKL